MTCSSRCRGPEGAGGDLMKIANDLRLMNSGPHGGFGEIRLAAMQLGSTIMPGNITRYRGDDDAGADEGDRQRHGDHPGGRPR